MDRLSLCICAAAMITVLYRIILLTITKARLSLPPGPRGSFLSGVQSQLPHSEPWKVYAAWSKTYGPLLSFRVYNRTTIVLNDHKSVHDLLDRRSAQYSDRPRAVFYHDLCGRGKTVFNISSLDDRHKQYRKALQVGLSPRAVRSYMPIIEEELSRLLQGFKDTPENYPVHIRRNAAAVIMRITYGYSTADTDDNFFVDLAEQANRISGWALAPGRWLVDYIPMLRHVPSWAPGAGFKRQAETWRQKLDQLSSTPHEWVKQQMRSGDNADSVTSHLLQPGGPGSSLVNAEQEDIIRWSASGIFAGAGDTTVAALISFVLLMALNPDIQNRARIEIDAIASGPNGSSQATDVDRYVYLLAVLKEVFRCAPVGPLALPHRATEEDEYNGYRIPKDATVVANVWAIMNDSDLYPNPEIFDPTRFLPSTQDASNTGQPQIDPRTYCYGYGRRTCPGSAFADTVMLYTMAAMLSQFTFSCDGKPTIEFTTGITSHIKPFKINITPRLF